MAQLTNLNVSPYYDDFDKNDNFNRVLFRPGFAVQARELTTLQSILQDQIESQGKHIFKEGSMVIPGQISYNNAYYSLQLASTFGGEDIVLNQFFNDTVPVTITGSTSGVKAKVIGFKAGTSTTQPILYYQYIQSGSDNQQITFDNSENITADITITHTTAYSSGVACATTHSSNASQVGSAVSVESGVYFIRGQFVRNAKQTLVLSESSFNETARVGFQIVESLITPESDESLTDNATGSTNYAAKGAHRLQITLTLVEKDATSTDDADFVELTRLRDGELQSQANNTIYSIIGEEIARRTESESGDYTVRPFQFSLSESVNNDFKGKTNRGIYTAGASTLQGNTASESLLTLEITPGKAFVKGYEIEKIAKTNIDLAKAREFNTVNASIATFELGNFARVDNLYGTPDITQISGESTAYKTMGLFDTKTSTRGAASGNQVGVARARSIEFDSGVVGDTSAQYKLFLFDVRMFTTLTISDTPSPTLIATHTNGGVQIKGATSGATGFVFGSLTSGTTITLTNVVGTFSSGEKLIASDSAETGAIIENASDADLTISSIVINRFSDARQVFMDDDDSGEDFTADLVLELTGETGQIILDGTDSTSGDSGDNILFESGTVNDATVDASDVLGLEDLRVARLKNPEKNVALFKFPKNVIKTLLTTDNNGVSDTQFTVRRQFVGTTNSSGVVTFTAGSNETFNAFADADYTLSILTAGGGTGVQGDIVDLDGKLSGTGTASLTVTDNSILGNAAKVKLVTTILRTSVTSKTKTTQLSKQLKVLASDADGAYGIRATDKEISLGRADVFRLQAVFDSEDTSSDATTPQFTISNLLGTFQRGEKITGGSSGAVARIITTTSPITYVLTEGFGATDFTASETITGASSGATATVGTLTEGSKVVTSNFTLDTGQRDNFYDIARIVRKTNVSEPRGRLLVVYDFFTHGSGDAFTVDSYSASAGQMNYGDIPVYTATRVDPDEPEPTGVFELRDCFDFRPAVEDITGTSTTLATVDQITDSSFDFFHRQFDGTGASTVDTPKPASNLQADFEFYIGKRATLFLSHEGDFSLVSGISAEEPRPPKDKEKSLKLASFFLPPFTFTPKDVGIERFKTQRFTMKDIGRLKERLETVESLTALSLLERDAESFEITDVNGLSRFKSGFVVDNFKGHRVGDAGNRDYKVAIDQENNELRPKCVLRNAKLVESVSTDTARTAAGYQKTGDLLTLPYTSSSFITQPFATRVENVQPYLVSQWVGLIKLTPSGDEWFETEVAPDLIINVEGNFDTVVAENRNSLGTVWNSWETQWSGVVASRTTNTNTGGSIIQRTIQTVRSDLRRTGLQTHVVEDVVEESQGTRVISRALIPFVRPRTIEFEGNGFLPNTRLYVFFDKQDVNAFITPSSSTYTSDTTIVAGSPLISTPAGKIEGSFTIPEYRFPGTTQNPKFRTGEVEFRITSSPENNVAVKKGDQQPNTAGQITYNAVGILETEQETIIATRNGILTQTDVSQTTQRTNTTTSQRVIRVQQQDSGDDGGGGGGGTSFGAATSGMGDPGASGATYGDPLAQTFIIGESGGAFITKVDGFFSAKDNVLPVWVEIRNVVNGYPGPKVLPFGRKLLEPSEVNISDDSTTATPFTFDSPVYVQEGFEYCIVFQTASLDYRMWICQLGEVDVSGTNRVVSRQPYLGSLFKSQNNTAWSPVQAEDLKFTIHKAVFSTAASTITLTNDNIGDSFTAEDGTTTVYGRRLQNNPLTLTNSSTAMRVKHFDHGMYSTSNNVKITGAKSGIETTLNGAITATATSLTLTSNTGFEASSLSSRCYVKIDNEILFGTLSGSNITSLTRGDDGTTAAAHSNGATVELYQILKTPLIEINKTHTSISAIDMDSYQITLTTAPTIAGASTSAEVGRSTVYVSENYRLETFRTQISVLELVGTKINAELKSTSGTSPSGSETSFTTATTAISVPLNENFNLDTSRIIASPINETNELSGAKSLFLDLKLETDNTNVSPVIDLDRCSINAIGNVVNNVDSASDVNETFFASTEPVGDNNSAIYMTKKIALETPATALKVFFAGNKIGTSDIKVLFKILRSDQADDFDDIGYEFFNTTGIPDSTTATSLQRDDFQEYLYTAGVTDDGIGDSLPEFIAFSIKIVLQATNAAEPPRIKDLRAIALAT